jgi:hypothetical protein
MPKNTPLVNDENDNNDDLPPEFDSSKQASGSNGDGSSDSQGIDIDALNDMDIDSRKVSDGLNRLNNPKGDWKKSERWEFAKFVDGNDTLPSDIDHSGRTYFSFKGLPEVRTVGGIDYRPKLYFRISPDHRPHKEDQSKDDMAYRLWLKVNEMYVVMNETKATKYRQVISMLVNDDYVVNTMNGDNGPMITQIKVERKRV